MVGNQEEHIIFPKPDEDVTAPSRKQDHIELAFKSQIAAANNDTRFFYEPLLSAHASVNNIPTSNFGNKVLKAPLWVSSMTGGTQLARKINHNLARACHDFGLGMGLGSCRQLLQEDTYLKDFDVRSIIGDDLPFFANLGIAQVEQLIATNCTHLIPELLDKLRVDGLIIHINPLQEWLQPEGDIFHVSPLETIEIFIEKYPHINLIIKEVGQGMGYNSLKALFQLPILAIDFAALGGTNFSQIELMRNQKSAQGAFHNLTFVGHTAIEMVQFCNQILTDLHPDEIKCKQVIISGGVGDFLDGFYLINKININAIYGQASGFLKHAKESYDELHTYVADQIKGLSLANSFLRVK
ncbi:MAG: isopentenyl-diphosphate delta-isomerase [Saprospiraceae bacterium]|nr:isopentenyl-diphosphate delta-isomerase [Saprospiraceae bacterium]